MRTLALVSRDHGLDVPAPVEDDDRDEDTGRDGRLGSPSPVVSEADRVAEATRREVFSVLELDRAVNLTSILSVSFFKYQGLQG